MHDAHLEENMSDCRIQKKMKARYTLVIQNVLFSFYRLTLTKPSKFDDMINVNTQNYIFTNK